MSAERYRKLVESLLEKTQDDNVPWLPVGDQSTLQTKIAGYTVQISEGESSRGSVYTIDLLDRDGEIVDSFTDEDIDGKEPATFLPYFEKMRTLFNLARRKATGADKALDDVIKALENLPPF